MMNHTDTWNSVEKHGPVTKVTHNYPSRPSWKAYGKGRAIVEMSLAPGWDRVDMRCTELPEGDRGQKTVYVHVPVESVIKLLQENGYTVTKS